MSAPFLSDAYVDAALSTFISGYSNGDYFADRVCPIIETNKKGGKFQKYDRKDVTRIGSSEMAETGEASEAGYSITTADFDCTLRGLKDLVPKSLISGADDPQQPLEKSAANITNRLLLEREDRVATLLTTAANFATANTGAVANVWSNPTSGTPLDDIYSGLAAIAPGMEADTQLVMVMAREVWNALRKHPDVIAGGATRASLKLPEAADLFGVDEILISDAQKNTANYGQTASYSRVWTATTCVAVRVPRGEPRGEQGLCSGTFRFRVDGQEPMRVRRWFNPEKGHGGSEVVQVEHADDEKMIQDDMGYLWTSVLS